MRIGGKPWVVLAAVLVTWAVSGTAIGYEMPTLTLWAWNGPDDLRFINPGQVGVAFLAGTVVANGLSVKSSPRLRELKIAAGTRLVAVVRIETHASLPARDSGSQREQIVQRVLELTDRPGVSEVQIDFDAVQSERDFYHRLMADLRGKMHPGLRLSMTALSSWCLGDPWVARMPVDRVIPMLFRMGNDDGRVRSHLSSGAAFGPEVCRGDVGISADEPLPKPPAGVRIWLFNPRPWDQETLDQLVTALEKL